MKNFSDQLWSQLEIIFRDLPPVEERIAAFDADGTLWAHDVGETFFEHLIQRQLLSNLPKNPWIHYENLKVTESPQTAYLWLAQIFDGWPLQKVQEWAADAVANTRPFPVFEDQKNLIQKLKDHGFQIFIVTASVAWAVEPASLRVGLEPKQVIGIKTKICPEGKVTATSDGPITYREGKTAALLAATDGRRPYFASGNTEGDLHLLESAQFRLTIQSAQEGDSNFETERRMQNLARERRWMSHRF